MHSLSSHNPVGRFDGRADVYARHRPDYPAAAIEYIIGVCGLGGQSLLVDVGSGTGISARQFAAGGIPVLGIEPNDQMRAQAEQAELPAGVPSLSYQPGRAEATGLPDASADGVLAAQAFHWFDVEPTLREFERILRPGGWVALMWNERDETDAFTRAYGDIIRTSPDTTLVEGTRVRSGEVLMHSALFHRAQRTEFGHSQVADEEGLLGRALSTSYVPREPAAREQMMVQLRTLFASSQQDGQVRLQYRTTVYLAQK